MIFFCKVTVLFLTWNPYYYDGVFESPHFVLGLWMLKYMWKPMVTLIGSKPVIHIFKKEYTVRRLRKKWAFSYDFFANDHVFLPRMASKVYCHYWDINFEKISTIWDQAQLATSIFQFVMIFYIINLHLITWIPQIPHAPRVIF